MRFNWFVSGEEPLSDMAIGAMGEAQMAGRLYVSPITAWELALAARKANNAPQLGNLSVAIWFRKAMHSTAAKPAPISQRIAIEAAEVVAATGHKDPGDCYLIATARIRKIPIVTRDATMLKLASQNYLEIIQC